MPHLPAAAGAASARPSLRLPRGCRVAALSAVGSTLDGLDRPSCETIVRSAYGCQRLHFAATIMEDSNGRKCVAWRERVCVRTWVLVFGSLNVSPPRPQPRCAPSRNRNGVGNRLRCRGRPFTERQGMRIEYVQIGTASLQTEKPDRQHRAVQCENQQPRPADTNTLLLGWWSASGRGRQGRRAAHAG